jgi:hypothetical protein
LALNISIITLNARAHCTVKEPFEPLAARKRWRGLSGCFCLSPTPYFKIGRAHHLLLVGRPSVALTAGRTVTTPPAHRPHLNGGRLFSQYVEFCRSDTLPVLERRPPSSRWSSQVNTLPIAKIQTRSKQNKGMHKFSSVYSERGVLLPVLTSGGPRKKADEHSSTR